MWYGNLCNWAGWSNLTHIGDSLAAIETGQ